MDTQKQLNKQLIEAAQNGHTETARAIEEAARQRAAKSEAGRD